MHLRNLSIFAPFHAHRKLLVSIESFRLSRPVLNFVTHSISISGTPIIDIEWVTKFRTGLESLKDSIDTSNFLCAWNGAKIDRLRKCIGLDGDYAEKINPKFRFPIL